MAVYVGGAYEREFDSKTKSRVNKYEITAPSAKGDTGTLEIGTQFGGDKGFMFDAKLQGNAGKKEGVSASFGIKYNF